MNMSKVVLRLLHKPAFGRSAKYLFETHGHFRRKILQRAVRPINSALSTLQILVQNRARLPLYYNFAAIDAVIKHFGLVWMPWRRWLA